MLLFHAILRAVATALQSEFSLLVGLLPRRAMLPLLPASAHNREHQRHCQDPDEFRCRAPFGCGGTALEPGPTSETLEPAPWVPWSGRSLVAAVKGEFGAILRSRLDGREAMVVPARRHHHGAAAMMGSSCNAVEMVAGGSD